MRRHKHSLSHFKLASFDMGELVPVGCYEVLPGDTVQQASAALLRTVPLLAPVMHPVSVRMHHWYVPYRLLWDGFEDFITGGSDGEGGSSGAFPTITAGGGGFAAGGVLDYLGVPPSVASLEVSALPVRAYNLIFNEFYRDQDLVTPLAVPTTSGADVTSPLTLQIIAWEKDYFTAARPWPQKGPEVTLPLGTSAPVVGDGTSLSFDVGGTTNNRLGSPGGGVNTVNFIDAGVGSAGAAIWNDTGLEADLSGATAASVAAIREAFALQRYAEARAMYGSRYTEYLRYLGVRSSDARLQRPEYLGGGKQTIAFSEVLQTGSDFDANSGVGTLRGHGIAAMRSRRYRRFFEEHGVVLSLMSVRPKAMYANALHRMWNRRTKEDFWQKELELIGQQEIERREIFAEAGAGGDTVFGYGDRYSEYQHQPSEVLGEFRDTTLNFWHLARILASAPTLNESFIRADVSKRIHAVSSNDVLWVMVNHSIQARRPVRRVRMPRIV